MLEYVLLSQRRRRRVSLPLRNGSHIAHHILNAFEITVLGQARCGHLTGREGLPIEPREPFVRFYLGDTAGAGPDTLMGNMREKLHEKVFRGSRYVARDGDLRGKMEV